MPHGQLVRSGVSLGRRWQVMKPPITSNDTLITSWERPPNFPDIPGVLDVDGLDKIRVRAFGRDAANETGDLHLSGWYEDGQGQDMGQVNIILGTHTDGFPDNYHQNVKSVFDDGLAWLEADTYALTADPESMMSFVNIPNGTAYLEIDLSSARYKYIFSELLVAGGVLSAEMGMVYMPVG